MALVTGASSGIGEAAALALARRGAAVALAARRTDRLETLAETIGSAGGTALSLRADITDEEEARGAVERTVAEPGRLDTLGNNAGTMLLGPVLDAPLEEWNRMVGVSGSARRSPGSNGSRPPISRTRSRISSRARATSPSTKCSFAPPSRSGRNLSSSGRSSDRMLATPSPYQPVGPRRRARRPESVLRRTGQLHVSANVPV